MGRVYKPLPYYSEEQVEQAIQDGDLEILRLAGASFGMYNPNWKVAQDLCIRLTEHSDKTVRGNAILGLSYVARFRGKLEKHIVEPVLLRALMDPEQEVQERAQDAVSEINNFMNWRIGVGPDISN